MHTRRHWLSFVLLATALASVPQARASSTATTTSLSLSSESVSTGTKVTLTARVTAGGVAVTRGLVNFCDASAKYCTDIHIVGSAQLTSAGTAVLNFYPGAGSHSYKAVFVGTTSAQGSSSIATTLTVSGTYPTTLGLTTAGNPGSQTLAASVSAAEGAPALAGTVSFTDSSNGNAPLGTAALSSPGISYAASDNFPACGLSPASAVPADFNGDGKTDLASYSYPYWAPSNAICVQAGNGDGTFQPGIVTSIGAGQTVNGLWVADFNADGKPDLVLLQRNNSNDVYELTILLGKGDGTFAVQPPIPMPQTPTGYTTSFSSLAIGDFNGDGLPDMAVAANSGYQDYLFSLLGKGDGTFTMGSVANDPTSTYDSLVAGDFNGDGKLDIAFRNSGGYGYIQVSMGHGDGTFGPPSPVANEGVNSGTTDPLVADFNGDGKLDIAALGFPGGVIFLGNGDGTFSQTPNGVPDVGGSGWGTDASDADVSFAADFNGDGIVDLAYVRNGNLSDPGSLAIELGKGDGTFVPADYIGFGQGPFSLEAVDLNGDGNPDLIEAAPSSNKIQVQIAQGPQASTAPIPITPIGSGIHQVVATYSGDAIYGKSSATIGITAVQVTTAITLKAAPPSSSYGQQVALTASLAPYGAGSLSTNGETVTFFNGKSQLGTGKLANGSASLNATSLPTGTDTLSASYAGDANFTASTSAAVPFKVSQAAPTLVWPTPAPVPAGSALSATQLDATASVPGSFVYSPAAGTVVKAGTQTLSVKFTPTDSTDYTSATATVTLTGTVPAAAPVLNPANGAIGAGGGPITITDATAGATIYYTTNGTAPTTASTKYTGAISVTKNETLEAIAVATGYTQSPVTTGVYTVQAATPVASVPGGLYGAGFSVTLTDATPGATIYYTTNGTAPTTASTKYTGPVAISDNVNLQAMAVANGYANSLAGFWAYTVHAAFPTYSVPGGIYQNPGISVTISEATPGATVYYTTNGTTPTTSSTKYTGTAISVTSNETLNSIAVAPGYAVSLFAPISYQIRAATPVLSVLGGTYGPLQGVTITDATPGATIYYTLDGSTPTTASKVYSGPLTVTSSEQLNSIAVAPNFYTSYIGGAIYTIAGWPTGIAEPASAVGNTTATLNASLNSLGLPGSYWFQYGTSSTALTTKTTAAALNSINGVVQVSTPVTGLTPNTTYYYQVVATSAGGTATGAVLSFTTN